MARPTSSGNGHGSGANDSSVSSTAKPGSTATKKAICGIIMPISEIDSCPEAHWGEVLSIITDVIHDAGFEPNLVSNSDDVGVIQKRIIQNLYDNPIVVCDVSGRNSNVMFELGMRLAFDKATIIIKDDKTPFSFDTAPIEHIPYRRDLRFSDIVEFKKKLREKIIATYKSFQKDPGQTAFLKHFGQFKVAQLEEREVSGQEFIFEELREIRRLIGRPMESRSYWERDFDPPREGEIDICLGDLEGRPERVGQLLQEISNIKAIESARVTDSFGHPHVYVRSKFGSPAARRRMEDKVRSLALSMMAEPDS